MLTVIDVNRQTYRDRHTNTPRQTNKDTEIKKARRRKVRRNN